MIVAYPNHDEAAGDFSFEYWVDAYKKGDPAPEPEPEKVVEPEPKPVKIEDPKPVVYTKKEGGESEEDKMMFYILCGVAGLIVIVIICVCVCFCRKKRENQIIQVQGTNDKDFEMGSQISQLGIQNNEGDLKLDTISDHEQHGGENDTIGQDTGRKDKVLGI